jgi:hypothetical protein
MSSEAHAALVASLREKLGALRLQGGISDQFVDWHGRLAACAEAITKDVPSCTNLCSELLAQALLEAEPRRALAAPGANMSP